MFDTDTLVDQCLQAVQTENDPQRAVREILLRTLEKPDPVAQTMGKDEGGIDIIFNSPELTVLNAIWAPGMNLYPHDHQMWACIGIYGGVEDNKLYKRGADTIKLSGGRELRESEVLALGVDAIHSVANPELKFTGAILKAASDKNGRTIYLLTDESYRRILFDGNTFTSPAASYNATMVLYTYGKQLLAPGQRLGYIALSPRMPDRELLRDAVTLSRIIGGWQVPNNVMAYALPELEHVSVDIPRLQARRDRVVETLAAMGYELNKPDSTFYIVAKSPIEDDMAFTEMLAEHNVFVGPGTIFELPGYFRLSITANEDMIERSFPGLEKALKQATS